jgi:hypothetical protein
VGAWTPGDGDLRQALETILRIGLRPAKLAEAPDTFVIALALGPDPGWETNLARAIAVEERLLALLIEVFGSGQAGMAIRFLLGACPESRSLPLKTRRRMAAEELELQVATFLKNYEDDLLEDIVVEILRRSGTHVSDVAV